MASRRGKDSVAKRRKIEHPEPELVTHSDETLFMVVDIVVKSGYLNLDNLTTLHHSAKWVRECLKEFIFPLCIDSKTKVVHVKTSETWDAFRLCNARRNQFSKLKDVECFNGRPALNLVEILIVYDYLDLAFELIKQFGMKMDYQWNTAVILNGRISTYHIFRQKFEQRDKNCLFSHTLNFSLPPIGDSTQLEKLNIWDEWIKNQNFSLLCLVFIDNIMRIRSATALSYIKSKLDSPVPLWLWQQRRTAKNIREYILNRVGNQRAKFKSILKHARLWGNPEALEFCKVFVPRKINKK